MPSHWRHIVSGRSNGQGMSLYWSCRKNCNTCYAPDVRHTEAISAEWPLLVCGLQLSSLIVSRRYRTDCMKPGCGLLPDRLSLSFPKYAPCGLLGHQRACHFSHEDSFRCSGLYPVTEEYGLFCFCGHYAKIQSLPATLYWWLLIGLPVPLILVFVFRCPKDNISINNLQHDF